MGDLVVLVKGTAAVLERTTWYLDMDTAQTQGSTPLRRTRDSRCKDGDRQNNIAQLPVYTHQPPDNMLTQGRNIHCRGIIRDGLVDINCMIELLEEGCRGESLCILADLD